MGRNAGQGCPRAGFRRVSGAEEADWRMDREVVSEAEGFGELGVKGPELTHSRYN